MPTNAKKQAIADYQGHEFILTREFDAPRELVFRAWTDPQFLAQWWGPRGFTNPVCEWNAQPGKAIRVVMRAPNGVEYPMGGEFRDIVPPELLVFTAGALDEKGSLLFELLHTALFVARGARTVLTLRSRVIATTPDAGKYIGGFEAGMAQSLDRLESLLPGMGAGKNEIVISRIVSAPRELVWQGMTDPQQVIHWWGPRGFTTTVETMEVRVGGSWRHVMHGPDGTNYPNESVFTEVQPPERLVLKNSGGKESGTSVHFEKIWTFEPAGEGKTKVTIRLVFPSVAERDHVAREFGAVEGGKQTLERLDEHLARRD